jgi:hypothetical protein
MAQSTSAGSTSGNELRVPVPSVVFRVVDSIINHPISGKPLPPFVTDSSYRTTGRHLPIPVDPSSPAKDIDIPPDSVDSHPASFIGKATFGRFGTPALEAWYGRNYQTFDLLANGGYEQSMGHVTDGDYSQFNAGLSGGVYIPNTAYPLLARSRVQSALSFFTREFGLYGNTLQPVLPDLTFRRRLTLFKADADIISRLNPVASYDAGIRLDMLSISETMFERIRDQEILESRSQEVWFGLHGSTELTVFEQSTKAFLSADFGSRPRAQEGISAPSFISGGLSGRYSIQDDLPLEYDASVYVYRGTDGTAHFRLYPSVSLQYTLQANTIIFASVLPAVKKNTLRGLMERNPYTQIAAPVLHTDKPLDIRLGAAADFRPDVSGRAYVFYSLVHTLPVFTRMTPPMHRQYDVMYIDNAHFLGLTVEGSASFDDIGSFDAGVTIQSARNDKLDSSIPYAAGFEATVCHHYAFGFGLATTATARLLGSRYTGKDDLPFHLQLDLSAEYPVSEHVSVHAAIINLLDDTWQEWDGYDQLPLFFSAGLICRL